MTVEAVGPVLVTGGAGLIGAAVIAELGDDAVSFDRDVNADDDVTDLDAVIAAVEAHRPRAIVHLAAMVGVATDADPHTATIVNVVGTSNVLEAARRTGTTRVVLASSIMRQAGTSGGPRNLYGAHKLVAELEADAYRRLHGLDPVVVVIAGTLGAGTRPASPQRAPHLHLVQQVAAGRPARLEADARWQLPLRRTASVARILAGAATSPHPKPFYQAGGRLTTLTELVDAARRGVPDADVEIVGGDWASIDPVDSTDAERDFGVATEGPDEMVGQTLDELRLAVVASSRRMSLPASSRGTALTTTQSRGHL